MTHIPLFSDLPLIRHLPFKIQAAIFLILIATFFLYYLNIRWTGTPENGTPRRTSYHYTPTLHPLGLGSYYNGPTHPDASAFPGGNPPANWRPGLDPIRFATKQMRQNVYIRQGRHWAAQLGLHNLSTEQLIHLGRRCAYCGNSGDVTLIQMDHIIPWIEGGATHESNLQGLCVQCNMTKGSMSDAQARQTYIAQTGRLPVT